ncbi:succinate dehydrogenase assembly factor 2, mitochondrial [Diachasma alloeum]|uniref:succinate dehydrogenase assembly factor 2, mitochondrial n=1 Tax=Diachasma alloeum TaxID=454923 RepID=UPI0007384040|nr:succinate dehydrogenase assembly factor 2, mitochondrial [Diachasma alloeum]
MNPIVRSCTNLVKPSSFLRAITTGNVTSAGFDDLHHPEGHEPGIPPYVEREAENVDLKRARLIYQSRKRGMLENGLLLSTFAKKYLNEFDDHKLSLYDRLINIPSNDWDIFYWAVGVKPTPEEFNNEVMDLLKKHVKNDDRQSRIVQPDLY